MLKKPSSCQGCPMYGTGEGFVPDQPSSDPKVIILGQNPGQNEETGHSITSYEEGDPVYKKVDPQPFIGATGYMLKHTFIPYLNLSTDHISYHNVLKCRWMRNGRLTNDLPPEGTLGKAVEHCTNAHLQFPQKLGSVPIIAQGELAFHYATGQMNRPKPVRDKITQWRGFLGKNRTYITTHIANFLRDPRQKYIGRLDWIKAGKWLQGRWPRLLTKPWIINQTTHPGAIHDWFAAATDRLLYCDTEYVRETQFLTLIGCAYKDAKGNLQGCQLRWSDGAIPGHVKQAFVAAFRHFVQRNRTGWHNFAADLPVIKAAWNIHFSEYKELEDSMLAHALVDSELPHDLGFCASIYSDYDKLKHLSSTDFMLYNWGDCVTGLEVLEGCHEAFRNDKGIRDVYYNQSLPVARHLLYSKEKGIVVNGDKVLRASAIVEKYIQHALAYVEAYCPELNINSGQQLKGWLYDMEGLPKQRGKGKKVTLDATAIIKLRLWYCQQVDIEPPDMEQEVWTPEYLEECIENGEHVLLCALSAYNFHEDKTRKYLKQLVIDG